MSENGVTNKDLYGYSVEMVIKYEDTDGTIKVLDTIVGTVLEDAPGSGTYANGNLEVVIDKAITATYTTRVLPPLSPFTTEYNYFYNIDINEDPTITDGKDNLRVLRGKCAIRV